MNRIFVCGDIHGHYEINKLNSKKFPEGKELTKDDYVIQVGDFGLIFYNETTPEENYWLDWLNDKPWTTLFIDGNHDNKPRLDELPVIEKFDNEVGVVKDSVFYLKRGNVYTIAGKKFLTFGGAFSIDKQHRKEGIDWWPEEEANYIETKNLYNSLEKEGWNVEYIITHEAPSYVRDVLHSHHIEDSYTVRVLDDVFGNSSFNFRHHYFGHHHMDKTVYDKHTCLYEKIREL